MRSSGPTLLRWLAPVLAGALFMPGLAPLALWPSAILSIACLVYLLHRQSTRSAFFTGWLYGAGFFGTGASWIYVSIHVYGHATPPLAAALTGLFCLGLAVLTGLQASLYVRLADPAGAAPGVLLFAALWVLFEWLRSWLLTGFPWLYAGYVTLDMPAAGWAPLLGVFGQSFLVVALGSGLAALAVSAARQRPAAARRLGLWVIVAVAGLPLGTAEWTEPSGEPISVAIYQPNIPLEKKWSPHHFRPILRQYEIATLSQVGTTDLVLWPESAIPAYRDSVAPYLDRMADAAKRGGTTLVTGIPTRDGEGRYNSIVALGTGSGEYHKQKLVPFGEYVPLEHWLRGLIQFFDLPMSNFTAGPAVPPLLRGGGMSIAAFICYEVVYPDFVWQGARESDLLVTVSNDSWFGRSAGPLQHLQMARFRALETGRSMLRGTNNGVSAIIDHRGTIVETAPQFEEQLVTGEVQPRTGLTPVMVWGSLPLLCICALLVAVAAYRRYR